MAVVIGYIINTHSSDLGLTGLISFLLHFYRSFELFISIYLFIYLCEYIVKQITIPNGNCSLCGKRVSDGFTYTWNFLFFYFCVCKVFIPFLIIQCSFSNDMN